LRVKNEGRREKTAENIKEKENRIERDEIVSFYSNELLCCLQVET
jgi:hypothetical protein